mgnify:CR=1 FL=1
MHRVARLGIARSVTRNKTAPIMGSVMGRISEETPAYEVLSTGDNFDLRKYAAGTAVETSDAEGKAFGALAGYIGVMSAPKNEKKEKISMTAPVVSIPDGSDAMRMQFVLPSALADAPDPTVPGVRIVPRPAQTMVVERYTGSWDEADAKARALKLGDRARAAGHDVPEGLVGVAWEWRRFNPPWTIGFMRTNEICVPIVEGK